MANIKADEITKILREQIENYQQTVAVEEVGSVISVGDGIARIHGLDRCMAGEMLEFPHDVFGIALNLEEDQVGTVLLGDYTEIREGDTVKRTNKIMSVPVGDALIGRVVNPLGQPLDGKGPIATEGTQPVGAHRAGRYRPPAGARAAADRYQVDRRDDSDRPRPARVDHRRPPDRQDRHHSGYDSEPARRRHDLHLLRDRTEALDGRAGHQDAHGLRARWITRIVVVGVGVRTGNDAVHRAVRGLRHRRVFPRYASATRFASTTIFRSTRRPTARFRCCCGVLPAARLIPETFSFCTRAFSNAPRS